MITALFLHQIRTEINIRPQVHGVLDTPAHGLMSFFCYALRVHIYRGSRNTGQPVPYLAALLLVHYDTDELRGIADRHSHELDAGGNNPKIVTIHSRPVGMTSQAGISPLPDRV